jgi:hypothetical protein
VRCVIKPFQPAPNGCKVNHYYTLANQHISNTFWITKPGFTDADMNVIGPLIVTSWAVEVMPLLATSLRYDGAVLTDYRTQTGHAFQYLPPGSTTGGVAGSAYPNAVAFCVKLLTAQRGKSFHGRLYFSGIPGSWRDADNTVQVVRADELVAALNNVWAVVQGNGWDIAIASFRTLGADRPTALLTPLDSITYTDLVLDQMRRRKPGVGT